MTDVHTSRTRARRNHLSELRRGTEQIRVTIKRTG